MDWFEFQWDTWIFLYFYIVIDIFEDKYKYKKESIRKYKKISVYI